VPPTSVELHLATAADWRQVREIRLRALLDAPYAFASTYDRESAFAEEDWIGRLTSGSATFLANTDAGPVGICGGLPPRDGTTELVAMWVDPVVRGSGLAAKLVAAVAEWAAEQAAERIHLWVTGTNERARRLYEGLGFALTGEQQPLPSDPAVHEFGMARAV
jgi:GNAT superfamily N-acetyltransferase